MIWLKCLQASMHARSSRPVTVYFNCALFSFQEKVLAIFLSCISIAPIAYVLLASGYILKGRFGEYPIPQFLLWFSASQLPVPCPRQIWHSFWVRQVIGLQISACPMIWFLMKLIVLRNPRTCLTFLGNWIFKIASTCEGSGLYPVRLSSKPNYSNDAWQKRLFSVLICIPTLMWEALELCREFQYVLRTCRLWNEGCCQCRGTAYSFPCVWKDWPFKLGRYLKLAWLP